MRKTVIVKPGEEEIYVSVLAGNEIRKTEQPDERSQMHAHGLSRHVEVRVSVKHPVQCTGKTGICKIISFL